MSNVFEKRGLNSKSVENDAYAQKYFLKQIIYDTSLLYYYSFYTGTDQYNTCPHRIETNNLIYTANQ